MNFVKFKSVENKRSVSLSERNWHWIRYTTERGNMEKELGRVNLSVLLAAAIRPPKFDIDTGTSWYDCFHRNKKIQVDQAIVDHCEEVLPVAPAVGDTIIKTGEVLAFVKSKFTIGAPGSLMEEGETQLIIPANLVKENSLNIILDSATLHENENDVVSYSVDYNLNNVIITFNSPVQAEQKYTISYAKVI